MDYDEDINSCQTSADDIKQISDLDKRLDNGNEEPVEIEFKIPLIRISFNKLEYTKSYLFIVG